MINYFVVGLYFIISHKLLKMKSINQIFANHQYLLEEAAVKELVEAYDESQEAYFELQQDNKNLKDRDNLFLELLRDIQFSIKMELNKEQENQQLNIEQEPTDYKAAVENLQKYIQAFCRDNRIYL